MTLTPPPNAPQPPIPYFGVAPVAREHLSPKWIARDIALIWVTSFAAGFVVGFIGAASGMSFEQVFIFIALGNILVMIGGLTFSACVAPSSRRWAHIGWVTLGLWLTSLLNVLLFGTPLLQWLAATIVLAICMAIAGGLSYAIKPRK